MSGNAGISEVELHAFIDGELAPDRLREVEAAIRADPSLAARAAGFRAGKLHIRHAYGPLLDRSIPVEWVALARRRASPFRIPIPRPFAAIAAVLVCLITAAGTFAVSELRSGTPAEIVQAALDARDAASRPAQVIGISQGGDSRRYDSAVTAAIGLNVKVPDMTALGYQLVQIRIYGMASAGAAELSYRDRDNRLFTLYLRHSDGHVQFDQFKEDGVRICVWQDEELGTVMTGNVSTAAMQRLASLAYTGLTL